jgi:hypothetical protein
MSLQIDIRVAVVTSISVRTRSTLSVGTSAFRGSFWKDTCDEGGLAWDDTNNNNRALAAICGLFDHPVGAGE